MRQKAEGNEDRRPGGQSLCADDDEVSYLVNEQRRHEAQSELPVQQHRIDREAGDRADDGPEQMDAGIHLASGGRGLWRIARRATRSILLRVGVGLRMLSVALQVRRVLSIALWVLSVTWRSGGRWSLRALLVMLRRRVYTRRRGSRPIVARRRWVDRRVRRICGRIRQWLSSDRGCGRIRPCAESLAAAVLVRASVPLVPLS